MRGFPDLKEFCMGHNVIYFDPIPENKRKVKALVKARAFPAIEHERDVVCYIRYFGPWGMYHKEDGCISICPIDIDKAPGGLVGTVLHEILHLEHPEADAMRQKGKEDYINSLR